MIIILYLLLSLTLWHITYSGTVLYWSCKARKWLVTIATVDVAKSKWQQTCMRYDCKKFTSSIGFQVLRFEIGRFGGHALTV